MEEFTQGDGLVAMHFVKTRLGQDGVDGMKEVLTQGIEVAWATLVELDEIIHKNVGGGDRPLCQLVGR